MIGTKMPDNVTGKVCKQAIELAKTRNQKQLLSITRKIKANNIFDIYEQFSSSENRAFWASHDRRTMFAAVGCCKEVREIEDRFEAVKFVWAKLAEEAWIDNPYHGVSGTGLVAFGGFAFDPEKRKSAEWSQFPDSRFIVPSFLVACHGDAFYLTMNLHVTGECSTDNVKNKWDQFIHKLETSKNSSAVTNPSIENVEEVDPQGWIKSVHKAKQAIQDGKAEKIVMARELRVKLKETYGSVPILRSLEDIQQNSYIFSFEKSGYCFVGATPERLVKVQKRHVLSTCLAGTAPRGSNQEEDELLAKDLLDDPKNRNEHQFVVQMIGNALGKYCDSVDIPGQPIVQRLKNLQHLYTPVTAMLQEHGHLLDLVGALHPTPALGGTPREAAISFIRDYERMDRGWYGAPVGWMDDRGNGEFAVAIRSGLLHKDNMSLFAGCGVVADSDPEKEYEETKMKFQPMLQVLEGNE